MKNFAAACLFVFFAAALFAQDSGMISSATKTQTVERQKTLGLSDALKKMNASLSWDPFFQVCSITSITSNALKSHTAFFRIDGAGKNTIVLYDNNLLFNMRAPYLSDSGELLFPDIFVAQLAGLFKQSRQEDSSRYKIAAIIIDPGHGGKDPGAIGDLKIDGKKVKSVEKEIVLKVSTELFGLLKKTYPGKKIIMTRTGDTYPSLSARVDTANSVHLEENEAIIYISVHANSSFKKTARGYEVWYLSPEYRRDVIDKPKNDKSGVLSVINDMLEEQFTTESTLLSKMIADEFDRGFKGLMPSHGKGIKAEEWYVVKKARMPSVLVELGFVSNEEDTKLMLNSPKKFADVIFNGITKFVRSFESSGGFTEAAR